MHNRRAWVASYHDMIEAMEGLMRAVNEFAFDRELQGKTYDSAKQYFAATYRPLAQGMICLCEELIRQNQAFPQKFRADVATTDVIENEVRDQIRQLDTQIQDIEKLSNNVVGMALITPIFVDLKQKLQEKLEALYQFDAETATSFDRAMDLTANIVQGLAEIDSDKAFQAKTGTFHTMGLNMAWRSSLQKQWTAREEAMAKLAKENETARLIKAAEDGPLPVIPEGNVAGFVKKDGKLDGKATYDNAKWQQAHVLAGMKNAIFLIDMVAPIFDIYRWKTGLDPITQEKLSPFDQNEAAAFTALTFIPFGKLGKVAKAIKVSTRTDEFKFLFEGVGEIKQADNASKSTKFAKFMKLDKIEVTFKRNPKHDPEEFARQLADQEKGMNELTVSEYLANREKYLAQGRALEGNPAQQVARERAYTEKVNELQERGLTITAAKKQAKEWMDTQAALHNPDQIAGGKALNIGGLGDRRINSSIGSQWRYRIDIVDEKINQMIGQIPKENWKDTYLNVSLKQ
ncbi:polymorphic toxin type 15 domain-containing protein [Listeria booriae]|uniref:polymorphic toxin type 15 domain-containing protein n=1 Tax=Listeria booriae TaxID=1552123 RepID=UPI0016291131|nr:polymorphic toxin type 15 domain-containing protein [Listeria booriae]MBC1975860.1 hypothetical protein [Listeria booriae]MBC2033834.1 hypothetical protein [Listeria booriae]MBC2046877.1 hypothetical protein [Listeria booriae]